MPSLLGDGASLQTVLTGQGKRPAAWQPGDLFPHASSEPSAIKYSNVDACYGVT